MSKKPVIVHQAQSIPQPIALVKGATAQKRDDSWQNIITGIGSGQDKRLGNRVRHDLHTPDFFEQAYGGSSIMGRIVDIIPVEALRKWVQWTGVEAETSKLVTDRCSQLGMRDALLRSWIWARAFGGGCCHIVTDTKDPSRPLQKGEKVIALRDLSRWDLRVLTTDIEYDFGSPNWGHPRIYYLNVQMGSQFKGYPIHWTRMVRFDGQLVPRRTFIQNNYWHDSVLNKPYNSVRNYESSNDAAATCLQDFNVDVYKMKNLANYVSNGQEDIVKKRIELIQFSKSVIRAMILDSDDEDYENKGRSIEGVSDLLRQQANRLVADTDIPHTKLLGESPDGSNATGNSTSQQWYDFIGSEQENYLRPKLQRLIEIIFPDLMPKLEFKFKPLRVLDEKEQAEVRSQQSTTDKNYIEAGVLDPNEVADSRFGGDEYSLETKLDKEGRAAGLVVPGQQDMGGMGSGGATGEGMSGTQPYEGEGSPDGPSEPEPSAGGQPEGSHDPSPESQKPGTQFDFRNEQLAPTKTNMPKESAFISQTMSEPMRDPRFDPKIKGPGIPNKSRTFLPTRGTGVVAPSGYDFEKDAGQEGSSMEDPTAESSIGRKDAWDSQKALDKLYDRRPDLDPKSSMSVLNQTEKSLEKGIHSPHVAREGRAFSDFEEGKHPRDPSGEFGAGGKKSAKKPQENGKKPPTHKPEPKAKKGKEGPSLTEGATSALEKLKEAGEEGEKKDSEATPKRAATIIVKRGDHFLMGKRTDTGRWTLPGGVVEPGESHHQGGLRELKEETGMQANRIRFLGGRMVEPKQGENVHVNMYEHKATDDQDPDSKYDPDQEIGEWAWVPLKGPLPEDIANNLQHPNNVALQHLGLL